MPTLTHLYATVEGARRGGGGDDGGKKRKRNANAADRQQEAAAAQALEGPGTFTLERLLFIFRIITKTAYEVRAVQA